jgi:hypothetical protein
MEMRKLLRCYAERHHGQWEAFCLDFDIAVQGSSFEAVYHDLNVAVTDYVERVSGLPADDRDRLLHRRAPFWSRVRFLFAFLRAALRSSGGDDDERHGYTLARTV